MDGVTTSLRSLSTVRSAESAIGIQMHEGFGGVDAASSAARPLFESCFLINERKS